MTHIPNYISPENKKEVDELMKPLREAETKEEKAEARRIINEKVTHDTSTVSDRLN